MLPAKYLNGQAVLAIPAYAATRIETNEDSSSSNQPKRNAKSNKTKHRQKRAEHSRELCGA